VDREEIINMLKVAGLPPRQARRILRAARRFEGDVDEYDHFLYGDRRFRLPRELEAYLEEVARALG